MEYITEYDTLNKKIEMEKYILLFFSSTECSVCHADYPVIDTMVNKMKFPAVHINVSEATFIAGQLGIFSVPAVLIFYEGKEYVRQARFIDFQKLQSKMEQMIEA